MVINKKNKRKKKVFRIFLEKAYSSDNIRVRVEGYIDICAKDVTHAAVKFDKMKTGKDSCLSTIDPRIVWNWEDAPLSEEELADKGIDYEDFSFGSTEDPIEELRADD